MNNPAEHLYTLPALSWENMQKVAMELANSLHPSDVIALKGKVGAGKTTFARALITTLADEATEVTSPTFTLMQSYNVHIQGKPQIIWHLDLYRLEDAHELDALGLDELWPHIVLVEWPEIAQTRLPESTLYIELSFTRNTDTRCLKFLGNDAWKTRLKEIIHD